MNKVFTKVQEPASFSGGQSAWQQYLNKNLNRDKPVEKGAPPGKFQVNLSFIVDQDGDIRDVVAETNPGYFTKDEAIRFMLSNPKWIPAKQNGHNVSSRVKLSITFSITEE
ncbi:MAG: energy transducer TonB [Chitinophagaceae bacterium]|nr:energy transducer TonB [Chitinophagaceae bacterium]